MLFNSNCVPKSKLIMALRGYDVFFRGADATKASVIPNGYFLAYHGGSFSILGEAVS